MHKLKLPHPKRLRSNTRAVSPAISMIIITAATIVMVLVSSSYAYSALQRQQSASEFQAMQKSFRTFDDTVRDVAWNRASTRATRFTAQFGFIELAGNTSIDVSVRGTDIPIPPVETAHLRYNLSTSFLTLDEGYRSYFIGSNKSAITDPSQDLGQAVISQRSRWLNIDLAYRVRVLVEPSTTSCTYVDIMVTRLEFNASITHAGSFDLIAKNSDVSTESYPLIPLSSTYYIDVDLAGAVTSVPVTLPAGTTKVIFNYIQSTVTVMV